MATLTIAKTQRTIGVRKHNRIEEVTHQETGLLSRFGSAAQVWADRYAAYKYNETDWRAIRP